MTDTDRQSSPLRRRMIDDMTVRNLSPATQRSYIHAVAKFNGHSLGIVCQAGELQELRAGEISAPPAIAVPVIAVLVFEGPLGHVAESPSFIFTLSDRSFDQVIAPYHNILVPDLCLASFIISFSFSFSLIRFELALQCFTNEDRPLGRSSHVISPLLGGLDDAKNPIGRSGSQGDDRRY